MKIQLLAVPRRLPRESIVIPVFSDQKLERSAEWGLFNPAQRKMVQAHLKTNPAGEGDVVAMTLPDHTGVVRVLFLGLGKQKDFTLRKVRVAVRHMVRSLMSSKVQTSSVLVQPFLLPNVSVEMVAQQITENALMANYTFAGGGKKKKDEVKNLSLLVNGAANLRAMQVGLSSGRVIAEAVNAVRDMCNTPGGEMTPKRLASDARLLAKDLEIQTTIFGEKEMARLGMGGVLGVSKGSQEEAQFIMLRYNGAPKKDAQPIVLVGKGITFDTGGLNLKPEKAMDGMHMDMSGAAAVIGATVAAARLKLPINVVALAPAAENMPGGSGYRPGDILRTISGKTIEIKNTDAEGRVVLADALGYAKRLKPLLVIDVATLTGACMVALGYRASGLFTADDGLAHAIEHAAEESGDYVWRLPLWDEYAGEVKGTFADVANLGKYPFGGAITAAHFLKVFAEGYPWVHLDIAPTMESIDDSFLAKGATGAAVRLLVHVLRTHAA